MEELKRCSQCGHDKPQDAFSRNKSRPDGLSVWCLDCLKWARSRFDHLDAPLGRNISLHDKVIGERIHNTDESWEKVCLGLGYWLEDKTLKPKQVDVILMRAIEQLAWTEIAELTGVTRDTVMYHYREGIKRIRKRYAEVG